MGCNSVEAAHIGTLSIFQYPVSDRMGCNLYSFCTIRRYNSFQYPVSDRMGCNNYRAADRESGLALSVSCIGSNGL